MVANWQFWSIYSGGHFDTRQMVLRTPFLMWPEELPNIVRMSSTSVGGKMRVQQQLETTIALQLVEASFFSSSPLQAKCSSRLFLQNFPFGQLIS